MLASDLALDLAIALDAAELSRKAGLEPDPWQAQVLRSSAPRILMNCCRQSGKSTITALLAVEPKDWVEEFESQGELFEKLRATMPEELKQQREQLRASV